LKIFIERRPTLLFTYSSSYKILQLPNGLQQIINGCIKGDRHAQASLYNTYSRKMMGVCLWYSKNKHEAEEILQDGFMLVFNNIKQYAGTGSFEGWMRKIMVNAALMNYRNKKSNIMHAVVEYDAALHDIKELPAANSLLEEKELLMLVQSLTPVYRMVFNLYIFEGLKHHEITAKLGISEGTSKSNLSDARTILQRKIIQQQTLFG